MFINPQVEHFGEVKRHRAADKVSPASVVVSAQAAKSL
jgi:hypothetical protein